MGSAVLALSDRLVALAKSKAPADRERLLLAVTDLCNKDGAACLSAPAQALVQEIFMGLVVQAEREIRQRLSEKLASAAWAPPALISVLALDEIEIARPVIAHSPILHDHDLIRLLVEATLEHQIEVARRPHIGAPVVSAILDGGQPDVMTALAGNQTADVSPLAMQRMVGASRLVAAMRAPLARHPKLNNELAQTLYGWVGEALRDSIGKRFTIDPSRLSTAVSEAVTDAMAGAPPGDETRSRWDSNPGEREQMERRLVAKLEQAGQLRPGYLLRALREGRITLFETALAALGRFTVVDVRKALNSDRPHLLALACSAVGLDRSVFPTILHLVRGLNCGQPRAEPSSTDHVARAFALSAVEAAEAFRAEASGI